jgi:hypothetical protein
MGEIKRDKFPGAGKTAGNTEIANRIVDRNRTVCTFSGNFPGVADSRRNLREILTVVPVTQNCAMQGVTMGEPVEDLHRACEDCRQIHKDADTISGIFPTSL